MRCRAWWISYDRRWGGHARGGVQEEGLARFVCEDRQCCLGTRMHTHTHTHTCKPSSPYPHPHPHTFAPLLYELPAVCMPPDAVQQTQLSPPAASMRRQSDLLHLAWRAGADAVCELVHGPEARRQPFVQIGSSACAPACAM
eukprot:1133519-Pelagomonas_calceolata.AAC.8